MVMLYEGSPATGGLSLLGGKDGLHLHQRHFCRRKTFVVGMRGIPRDVWSDIKCSSLCSSLLQESPEQHLNRWPNNEEEGERGKDSSVSYSLLLNSLIPFAFQVASLLCKLPHHMWRRCVLR